MSEQIPPAMSTAAWKEYRADPRYKHEWLMTDVSLAQTMALANAELPEDDSHKFTREDVTALNAAVARLNSNEWVIGLDLPLRGLADRIAALLPPET